MPPAKKSSQRRSAKKTAVRKATKRQAARKTVKQTTSRKTTGRKATKTAASRKATKKTAAKQPTAKRRTAKKRVSPKRASSGTTKRAGRVAKAGGRPVRRTIHRAGTLGQRIVDHLATVESAGAQEVAKVVKATRASVGATLSHLHRQGRIRRVGRGRYARRS